MSVRRESQTETATTATNQRVWRERVHRGSSWCCAANSRIDQRKGTYQRTEPLFDEWTKFTTKETEERQVPADRLIEMIMWLRLDKRSSLRLVRKSNHSLSSSTADLILKIENIEQSKDKTNSWRTWWLCGDCPNRTWQLGTLRYRVIWYVIDTLIQASIKKNGDPLASEAAIRNVLRNLERC